MQNSIISEGDLVWNVKIVNFIVRQGVVIEDDALVEVSIVVDHTVMTRVAS